jgi:hypothetical protein
MFYAHLTRWPLLSSGVAALCLLGCATGSKNAAAPASPPRFALHAEQVWQLNLPGGERFDASALTLEPDGSLLTLSDRGPGIYRIHFESRSPNANLERLPQCFTTEQLAPFAKEKIGRYDCEGLARDEGGRLYVSEEANRWILRYSPETKTVERLPIDFSPVKKYFDPTDLNASFEGVAVHGNILYVANERKRGRIIIVDLNTLRVIDDFCPRPSNQRFFDVHFSDLSWHQGALYALLREDCVVLKIDPAHHLILAEYSYRGMENDPRWRYQKDYPAGVMEGLAVDDQFFWLVTDNNGLPRVSQPKDRRPTLFRCSRPDVR